MEAADRVDSTCGIQMAYLKKWAGRSFNDLELRMPSLHNSTSKRPCKAYQGDALDQLCQDFSRRCLLRSALQSAQVFG